MVFLGEVERSPLFNFGGDCPMTRCVQLRLECVSGFQGHLVLGFCCGVNGRSVGANIFP